MGYLTTTERAWLENCLERTTLLILRYSGKDDLIDQDALRRLLAGESALGGRERQAVRQLVEALEAAESSSRKRHPRHSSWMAQASEDLSSLLRRQPQDSTRRGRLSPLALGTHQLRV